MSNTTFDISPDVTKRRDLEIVDYVSVLRTALRRPVEQCWLPRNPVVACDDSHALLTALNYSFYDHVPLRLSPDVIWITIARGFALHVNLHAEELRHQFVTHSGREKLIVVRDDFLPGRNNPWPEAFESFSEQIDLQTGGLSKLIRADFSTTGPTETAASNLMAMETFKSYFEYEMRMGCGIPNLTLSGSVDDWDRLRERAQEFAKYGLKEWIDALDPILEQFCKAKSGIIDLDFWRSIFRYNSGSGPAVLTGWANVFFPYFKNGPDELYQNPFLDDWKQRLEIDDEQQCEERMVDPQGIGLDAIPNCMTSVPLIAYWGDKKTDMRLVGGLLAVSQNQETMTVEPECGWAVVYEHSVDKIVESRSTLFGLS